MARPKAFDEEQALDAAIDVFREHGFEGTSAEMLVRALRIGRQSLYDTFGDKWKLYLSSMRRYIAGETQAHVLALRNEPRAIDGIGAMIDRVIADAGRSCLGVNSICEFGRSRQELAEIHDAAARTINAAIVERVREAQAEGDVTPDLDPKEAAGFLSASFAGARIAARGGADAKQLRALGRLTLRALQ
jgi:TetR/AcrR family transcriptional regulator, transcriptional repressor for nem operon